MVLSNLHVRALACGYAILSLPYVALALSVQHPSTGRAQYNEARAVSQTTETQGYHVNAFPSDLMRDVVVNSTTVRYNIPEEQQEIIYFRNFEEVGRKSKGFNVTQYDLEHHPERMALTGPQRLISGDDAIKFVAAGALAGVVITAACVLISASCGTYVGTNIGKFVSALGSNGGQSAIDFAREGVQSVAGNLPNNKRGELHEGFGCYYENGYDGVCHNENLAGPAYTAIANDDGSGTNTPIWSCYEAQDTDGTVNGYYTHCFGDNVDCHLQCGAGNPDVDSPYNDIGNA